MFIHVWEGGMGGLDSLLCTIGQFFFPYSVFTVLVIVALEVLYKFLMYMGTNSVTKSLPAEK